MQLKYKDFQITKNFHTSEFHCKNGVPVPHSLIANVVYLAYQLQRLRNLLGNPTIIINSAYRTKQYNDQIGGAPKSNHVNAQAADIRTQKYTPKELKQKIKQFVKDDLLPDGEIIEYGTFVHYAPSYNIKFSTINEIPY